MKLKLYEIVKLYLKKSKIEVVEEFKFHSLRKWRFDFAIPPSKIAIEVEGGVWISGRHTRGSGFVNDCEKYNNATALGWRVFRISNEQQLNFVIEFLTKSYVP